MNTREQIFEVVDLPLEKVEVPEWNTTIYVRGMTAAERDHWEMGIYGSKGETRFENIRSRLVVLTACDEKGQRIFQDGDADELGKKNAKVVIRLFDIAQRLSAVAQKDVDELTKN